MGLGVAGGNHKELANGIMTVKILQGLAICTHLDHLTYLQSYLALTEGCPYLSRSKKMVKSVLSKH